jgi:hypothetical protein
MNNIATTLTFIICMGTLSVAYSDPEAPKPGEGSIVLPPTTSTDRLKEREPWLIAMHGETLSSIGEIKIVRIEHEKSGVSNLARSAQWTHKTVWNLIENGVMTDYLSVGVALGLAPKFTIEYSNGMKAYCDACTARIVLPGGRTGNVVLIQKKPNKAQMATPRKPSD